MIKLVGWLGTLLLGGAAVPQVLKVWREGNAHGMSWGYVLLLLSGFICMLTFASVTDAGTALVVSYALQVTIFLLILFRKTFPRR